MFIAKKANGKTTIPSVFSETKHAQLFFHLKSMNPTLFVRLSAPCAPATLSTSVKPANNKALTSIDIQKRKPCNRVRVKQFKFLPEMMKTNDCRRKALVTYDRPLLNVQ